MDFLQGLNDEQKRAVETLSGPLLIIAGAGAGKTKTLTHRIANLIAHGVHGSHILAITFTNKAAKEMRERVHSLLGEGKNINEGMVGLPYVATFHALSVKILREHAALANRNRHFTIADDTDSISYIKVAMKELSIDPKQYEPRKLRSIISKQKGDGIDRKLYEADASGGIQTIVADVWNKYELSLARENAFDFDDLIAETVRLLENNKEIRDSYRKQWTHVHVDEYQDTNELQYRLTKFLIGPEHNICVVGDADQNIYSWRGANMKNMLHFEKDFPNTVTIFLEENYRSTNIILSAANAVIEKNVMRVPKNLYTKKAGGLPIGLYHASDERDEAFFIAARADALIHDGVLPDDIAVLYRANYQSRVIEEACLRQQIPYQVLGTKFFDRKEVKDILAYIRAALSRDNLSDIRRVINEPARGIGKVTIAKLFAGEDLSGAVAQKVREFYQIIDTISGKISGNDPLKPSELIITIINCSGFEAVLKAGDETDHERLENMYELVEVAKRYDALPAEEALENLLTDAALVSDQDTLEGGKHGVRLMTVHASKGLEFRYVFIVGMEQGLFPHERLGSDAREDSEEERRLFYVALTRAKEKLFLSYAEQRTLFGSTNYAVPSEFLSDIPQELIEQETFQSFVNKDGKGTKTIYLD